MLPLMYGEQEHAVKICFYFSHKTQMVPKVRGKRLNDTYIPIPSKKFKNRCVIKLCLRY